MPLSAEQRSLRARIAAHSKWAKHDPQKATEVMRAAGPGRLAYWEREVDPEGLFPEAERLRRADSARRAHMSRLALASSKARRKGGGADAA